LLAQTHRVYGGSGGDSTSVECLMSMTPQEEEEQEEEEEEI
jgi:hypothetical protein